VADARKSEGSAQQDASDVTKCVHAHKVAGEAVWAIKVPK
jgi:hypothetical protein